MEFFNEPAVKNAVFQRSKSQEIQVLLGLNKEMVTTSFERNNFKVFNSAEIVRFLAEQ